MSTVKRDQEIFAGLAKVTATQPSQKIDQQRFEIDLTTARNWEELSSVRSADFFMVEKNTGTAKIRINEINGPEYDMTIYHSMNKSPQIPIERIYIYNAAQPGKTLVFVLGGDASFQATTNPTIAAITGAINIADAAGDTINPTEMATTPTDYNVTCVAANTEYSQAIPTGTKKFMVKCRDTTSVIRRAFVTGKVAAPTDPYMTIWAGATYYEDQVKMTGKTIYLASPTAGAVVEIVVWS